MKLLLTPLYYRLKGRGLPSIVLEEEVVPSTSSANGTDDDWASFDGSTQNDLDISIIDDLQAECEVKVDSKGQDGIDLRDAATRGDLILKLRLSEEVLKSALRHMKISFQVNQDNN